MVYAWPQRQSNTDIEPVVMFCSKGSLTLIAVLFVCCAQAREFQFLNNLPGEVWIGSLGNANKPALNNGGWKLGVGQRMSVHSADDWAGRFWARTWCNAGNNHCETGDCGNRLECNGAGGEPPVTLAEITLKGHAGLDFYDISLVDGFNVKMSMTPLGGQGDGSQYSCARVGCDRELTHDCPQELRQVGSSGHVIACKSACRAFGTDQYCCAGAHNRPETCRSTDWPVNYPKFFKDRCPDAYSYAYDDHKSTFTCKAPAYLITIG